jgi:hypothetical protein
VAGGHFWTFGLYLISWKRFGIEGNPRKKPWICTQDTYNVKIREILCGGNPPKPRHTSWVVWQLFLGEDSRPRSRIFFSSDVELLQSAAALPGIQCGSASCYLTEAVCEVELLPKSLV